MFKLIYLSLGILLVVAFCASEPSYANNDIKCGFYREIIKILKEHNQTLKGYGLSNNKLYSLYSNENYWSMSITSPDGIMCIFAQGKFWIDHKNTEQSEAS